MKWRVGLWALIELLVASTWIVIGLFTWPNFNLGRYSLGRNHGSRCIRWKPHTSILLLVHPSQWAIYYALLGLSIDTFRPQQP